MLSTHDFHWWQWDQSGGRGSGRLAIWLDWAFKRSLSLESHELWHLRDEQPGQVNFAVGREELRRENVKGDWGLAELLRVGVDSPAVFWRKVLGAVAALPSISHHPTTIKVCQEPQPSSRVPAEAKSAAGAGLPYVYPADCCSRQLLVLPIPRSTSTCLSCKACKTNSLCAIPALCSTQHMGIHPSLGL